MLFENDEVMLLRPAGSEFYQLVSKVTRQGYLKPILAVIVCGFIGGSFALVSVLGFWAFAAGEASRLLVGLIALAVCFFMGWVLREGLWECLPKRTELDGKTGNCSITVYGMLTRRIAQSEIEHIGIKVIHGGTPRSVMGYSSVLYLCRTKGMRSLRFCMPASLEATRSAATVQGIALGREVGRILGKPLRQRLGRHWRVIQDERGNNSVGCKSNDEES